MVTEKRRAYSAAYYDKNREKLCTQQGVYRAANKDRIKKYDKQYQRKRKYGITSDEFVALLEKQKGCCAICCKVLEEGRDTHVDHDHKTGKVRGILCRDCNLGIGLLSDSLTLLCRAISYLKQTG